MAKQAENYMI
jgi:hypothetical protein